MARIMVNRATLYEEVWETPLSRLAPRYGVSDVALKKVCRRMDVPTPPRGHWVRIHHAHHVQRPRLPAPGPDTPLTHTFFVRPTEPDGAAREEKEKPELPAALKAAAETAVVPGALRNPDPFVARTRDVLRERLENWRPELLTYNRVSPWEPGTFDVGVCPGSVPRALRLLAAIAKAARRAGFEVTAGERGSERAVHFVVEGEAVPFRLREPMRQERIPLPEKERYGSRRYRFEHHPTGRLTLELTHHPWAAPRHTWRDTERQRLEDLVGPFLVGVYRAACAYRERRLEQQREREEAARRAEEERRLERLRAEEAERRRRLEAQAERWHRSQEVAAFVDEVERRATDASLTDDEREALAEWVRWAREHAERLDPLSWGLSVL